MIDGAPIIATLYQSDGTTVETDLVAGETGIFKFARGVQNVLLIFNGYTGGTHNRVLIKIEGTGAITAAATDSWYDISVAGGDGTIPIIVQLPPCRQFALAIPASGTTLQYKSTAKNCSVLGW